MARHNDKEKCHSDVSGAQTFQFECRNMEIDTISTLAGVLNATAVTFINASCALISDVETHKETNGPKLGGVLWNRGLGEFQDEMLVFGVWGSLWV